MASENWEQEKMNLLRYSNEESHRLTTESIETALLWLMREREYEEITVSEIVRRAGVSRSAFYKNYKTKEEVLAGLLKCNANKILRETYAQTKEGQGDFWEILFSKIAPYADAYRLIGNSSVQYLLFEVYNKVAMDYLNTLTEPNPYYMFFYAGGLSTVILQWVKNGVKESPREMAQIMRELI